MRPVDLQISTANKITVKHLIYAILKMIMVPTAIFKKNTVSLVQISGDTIVDNKAAEQLPITSTQIPATHSSPSYTLGLSLSSHMY